MSPKKSNKTVGVIGLGIMGGSFSRNLVAAGWRVVGFDIDAAKRRELAKAGVEIAGANLPPRIIAECSTFTIDDKEKAERMLRAAGHVMLDCPVSGTGSQAR